MVSHPEPSQHVRLGHHEQVLTAVSVVAANLGFELSLTRFEVARLNQSKALVIAVMSQPNDAATVDQKDT